MKHHRNRTRLRTAAVALAGAAVLSTVTAATAPAAEPRPGDRPGLQSWFEVPDDHGRLVMVPGGPDLRRRPATRAAGDPAVATVRATGPTANRINIVLVGDGYTREEMPKFAVAAEAAWESLVGREPFRSYAQFFNVYRVDVPSPASGISFDGSAGARPTPLGMRFGCHGVQRLLCADEAKVQQYAALAPGADQIIAIANSSSYGGSGVVGGTMTTTTSGHSLSGQVLVHEMGHSIGGLGDEYDYPFVTDDAPEPSYPNITRLPMDQMRQAQLKWSAWLGAPSPDNAVVGSYEGANHFSAGYFRPTPDSGMRTVGKEFNAPSMEAIIKRLYAKVRPIDAAPDDPRGFFLADQTVRIAAPASGSDRFEVTWTVGGRPVARGPGLFSIDLGRHTGEFSRGAWNLLGVTVRDTTPRVRDEGFRDARMTQSKSWPVWGG